MNIKIDQYINNHIRPYIMNYSLFKYLLFLIIPIICSSKTLPNTIPISINNQLAKLETSANGKIGVFAINTGNNEQIQHRSNERFPMGCTSKVMGVAAILKQSMTNESLMQQKVMYSKADILSWAPITKNHINNGMTVKELCAATIIYSDNTAMNLIVKQLGGLKTINDFAHSIGNQSFRQDHGWPDEANATPYTPYDTSTPKDMALSLEKLTLGDALGTKEREQLQNWLKSSVTGYSRIRSGVPKNWVVGDKTGTGYYYGVDNDIAIIWPPKRAPIILAIYYAGNTKDAKKRDDIIVKTTRIILNEFADTDKNLKLN